MNQNKRFGVGSVQFRYGMEFGQIDDGVFRHMIHQLFFVLDPDKKIAHELGVPGVLRNHPHRQTILFVRAHVAILNKNIVPLQISLYAVPD